MSKHRHTKTISKHTNLATTPHVEIFLHSCKDLPILDEDGYSDPYVRFSVGMENVSSTIKPKTLDPVYDEKFLVYVKPGEQELVIRVFDWDVHSEDNFAGEARVFLMGLPTGVSVKQDLPLSNVGSVQVTLTAHGFGTTKEEYEQSQVSAAATTKKWGPIEGVAKEDLKQAKFEDSNIANIGSMEDIHRRVEAARSATEWKGVGAEVGLKIWRIEKFQVKPWPANEYGRFYNGDSFIVLNTYKHATSNQMLYDVHFWLGEQSTKDEMGTAAYKTVELDDLLNCVPIQHREIEGHESELFLSYFKDPIVILDGGIDSGFNHVKPTEYAPRLLQIKGRKKIRVSEVELTANSLNNGDVFVLDAGLTLYIWRGSKANPKEVYKGATTVANLKSERGGKPKEVRLEEEGSPEFWNILGGKPETIKDASDAASDDEIEFSSESAAKLFKLSDASGKLRFTHVATGNLVKSMLGDNDAYILDAGNNIFVYVGKGASKAEREEAVCYAQKYLVDSGKSQFLPITRILQGTDSPFFDQFFH